MSHHMIAQASAKSKFASTSTRASAKSKNASTSTDIPDSLLQHLHHVCSSPESHPFVRPFGNMVSVIHMVVRDRPAPFPVGPAMASVAKFLEPSMDPANRLAFAVRAHKAGMQQFLGEVGGALTVLAQIEDRAGLVDAVQDMLDQWDGFGETFSHRCEEVWQLYIYLVFLDIKGEHALVTEVINHLSGLLDCSAQSLSTALSNTRPWAWGVLDALSKGEFQPLLSKWHVFFLREWHATWRSEFQSDSPRGEESLDDFWDSCFAGRFKVPWSDVMDAFQGCYMEGDSPVDVTKRLHSWIDPALGAHVTRSAWQALSAKSVNMKAMIDVLINSILDDAKSCIYRDNPLPPFEGSAAVSASTIVDEAEDRSRQSKPSGGYPSTKVSEGVMKVGAEIVRILGDTETCETPPDHLPGMHPLDGAPQRMSWKDYHANLCREHQYRHWWLAPGEKLSPKETAAQEQLRINALRVVQSDLVCTDQALVLRIIGGDLARGKIVLDTPNSPSKTSKTSNLPSVVVLPSSGHTPGIVSFGRGSAQGLPFVDHVLPEAIISRSHFNITYDQHKQKYCLSDNGTKWGTFVKVTKPSVLKCGDWLRVRAAEFVIRYCGGGCSCHRWHAQYRDQASIRRGWKPSQSMSLLPQDRPNLVDPDSTTQEGREEELKAELAGMFNSSSMNSRWTSNVVRLSRGAEAQKSLQPSEQAQARRSEQMLGDQDDFMPVRPMELEFISGPRMGEKVVLWDRVSTLGRCPSCTVQVHDPNVPNMSRIHCRFEFSGNRWHLIDNKSTNGTWRRLSGILEPSEPLPLSGGEIIMAGAHEFGVEALTAPGGYSPIPSVASQALREISAH